MEKNGGKGREVDCPLPSPFYHTVNVSIFCSGSSGETHWKCGSLVCGIVVGCIFRFQDCQVHYVLCTVKPLLSGQHRTRGCPQLRKCL